MWAAPPGIKSIDCGQEMCAFVKCFADDPNCERKYSDPQTLKFSGGPARLREPMQRQEL